MLRLIVVWLVNAVSLMIVAAVVPGVEVSSFGVAMAAALVIGLVNATLGEVLRFVGFPITILTLGLFLLVVNALMIKIAAAIVPGFRAAGCLPPLLGALLLSIVSTVLQTVVFAI